MAHLRTSLLILPWVAACASSSTPPASAARAAATGQPAGTGASAATATLAAGASPAIDGGVEAAPASGPGLAANASAPATPAERDARELEADRARWRAEHDAELARWTPALHAEAKALADRAYPNGKAAVEAAVKGHHRKPGHPERDRYRHPVETLAFFGFAPTMTVLDIGPGDGWYTELLAPALHERGHYIATTSDPNGPPASRSAFEGRRFKAFLDEAPELYGRVETLAVDPKAPKLGPDGSVDLVILMRGVHGMVNRGTLPAWLAEIRRALKPGGVLGIEEHRAPPQADAIASAKKGYVPEPWLIGQVEGAGFKLAGQSEINANPKDTKDHPEGVWTLPPTLRLGDKDRERYLAIGESDRMTLKFVKAKPPSP